MALGQTAPRKPVQVFILAGDESVLEQGLVEGRTAGVHSDFFPNAAAVKDEKRKHVNAAVYDVPYSPDVDYDALTPVAAAEVEIGEQRTRRADPKKRGRVPVPMAPFPAQATQAGHTTVVRGYLSVKFAGKYECRPGEGGSAFNVTTLNGTQVYRRDIGQAEAEIASVALQPKQRYAFKTVFFKTPGHAFRLPLINKPGTLTTAVAGNARYASLKDTAGAWVTARRCGAL